MRGLGHAADRRAAARSGCASRPERSARAARRRRRAGSASSAHASASGIRSTPSATVLSAFSASTCARSPGSSPASSSARSTCPRYSARSVDVGLGHHQPRAHARGPGRQRVELRRQQVAHAPALARGLEVRGEREQPLDARGSRSAGVSRSACSASATASGRAPRAAGRGGRARHLRREGLVGLGRREREVERSLLGLADRGRERAVERAPLARRRPRDAAAASSGWAARTRSPSTITRPASRASAIAPIASSWSRCRSSPSATASSSRCASCDA